MPLKRRCARARESRDCISRGRERESTRCGREQDSALAPPCFSSFAVLILPSLLRKLRKKRVWEVGGVADDSADC